MLLRAMAACFAARLPGKMMAMVLAAVVMAAGSAPAQTAPAAAASQTNASALSDQVAALTAMVEKLQARVSDLEEKLKASNTGGTATATPATTGTTGASNAPASAVVAAPPASGVPQTAAAAPALPKLDILRGTTVNFLFDGYYGYNFNSPIGRVNLMRVYDVSSNAFSLSQADLVLENAPDPEQGKRFGLRVDMQYGQATASLQGNAANEPRPDVYRNIFQAYGTYVIPVGGGLTVDVGKWASSLGLEGNYSKDQMNYSRSLLFAVLPFYHMGARFNYKVNNVLSLNYWITNGTQQTEPFNGFKDELGGLVLQPNKNISWTANYYLGQEHPDFQYLPGSTLANLPVVQGIPFAPIVNAPKGKLHIFDSYVTWAATPRLTFALEGDYLIERLQTNSAPSHVIGGAGYLRYQLSPRTAIAARSEYVSDRGGLFTGRTLAIEENTLTFEQKIAEGFLLREEWRRDGSNQPYFLTNALGVLQKDQNTATLGMVWWFGAKQGAW